LGLPEASVKTWEGELAQWEEDHSTPNPFEKQFKSISLLPYSHRLADNAMLAVTQDAVRKRLAVEEAEQMVSGTTYVLHEEISASQLITLGLDFEEQQCVEHVTF
jgi:hypothetical protein